MLKKFEVMMKSSCLSKAGDNEMVFVLKATDMCAPRAIRFWCAERIAEKLNVPTDTKIKDALICADVMEVQRNSMANDARIDSQIEMLRAQKSGFRK